MYHNFSFSRIWNKVMRIHEIVPQHNVVVNVSNKSHDIERVSSYV